MKIKVFCDSGANIYSLKEEIIDLEHDWNMTDNDWMMLSEEEKYLMVEDWALSGGFEIGWTDDI